MCVEKVMPPHVSLMGHIYLLDNLYNLITKMILIIILILITLILVNILQNAIETSNIVHVMYLIILLL